MCIIFLPRAQMEWENGDKLITVRPGKPYDWIQQKAEGT